MSDVTRILSAVECGDPKAAGQLLPLVYDELRRLAARRLAEEKPGHSLQATALVHEAYLRLVGNHADGPRGSPDWNSRGHFFAAAAEAMRRILVEAARRRGRLKHGGELARVELADVPALPGAGSDPDELLALDAALDGLAEFDPVKAQVVKLRYFTGLTIEQTAACLNVSPATAKRHWAVARAWLFRHLAADAAPGRDS